MTAGTAVRRRMTALTPGVLSCGLLTLLIAGSASATEDRAVQTRTVTVGPQYAAGGFHRWVFGTDYRRLLTTPIQVDVLDVQSFAGGLSPVRRVGGQQTKGLAMKGKDGRDYTFRGIDKDPTEILPEDLRGTFARAVVQDQMAAQHPAGAVVADELMEAAGIPHSAVKIVVMPDDPALGEFQKDFANVVGTIQEFAGEVSATNPGFRGATEVLKHKDLYARLDADPGERPDARAFLKARLFDLTIGDWDRHRDQWRWAKLPGNPLWQPLPDDRDQAFSRFEGVVLDLIRWYQPRLQKYRPTYPGMTGLTWNGWEQDRRLLAGLEWPVWKEVADDLQSRITDAAIDKAARRMPPEYFAIDGERLIHALKARRDRLPQAAEAFYRHLASEVDVYLTNQADLVEVKQLEGDDLEVRASRLGEEGQASSEPYFRRTLHKRETGEVRLYLAGGNDRVVSLGKRGGIRVRAIGGDGNDVVDDTKGGGTRLYDAAGAQVAEGPGSSLDTRPYTVPPGPKNAPWIPPRDWGRSTYFVPWASGGAELGLFLGAGFDTQRFGFRKEPYANRHVLRAGWSFGARTYRTDYQGEFHLENRDVFAAVDAYASGIESLRFFGFGNETTSSLGKDFYKVRQQQYSFTPTVAFFLGPKATFRLGPTLKYARMEDGDKDRLINQLQPYGAGEFGQVGAMGAFELDRRVGARKTPGGVQLLGAGYPRSGVHVLARGAVFPKAWDVDSTFGSVEGSASVYLTPGGERAPTLALRAGGKRVFGDYPFHEAAYVGGGGISGGTVRGLQRERYAGDSALFGNADLRLYVSRFNIFLPGDWGLFGFGDAGRVYFETEESDKWHYGYGGGLWFAWLDRANTVSIAYARSEGRNAVYVRAGFGF